MEFSIGIQIIMTATTTVTTVTSTKVVLSQEKAIPIEASIGPEGSTNLRLPDFKTIDTCRW
jgi:hypothetical protein